MQNLTHNGANINWSFFSSNKLISFLYSGTITILCLKNRINSSKKCFAKPIGKLLFFFIPFTIQAQCIVNTINADFEFPRVTGAGNYVNQNNNPAQLGWKTTATDGLLEFWSSPNIYGRTAYSGTQFVELNATQASGLYQDYNTSIATYFQYSFYHMGRDGVDTMVLRAGPPGGPYVDIKTARTGKQWIEYPGTYKVPKNQPVTRFIFEAVSTATGNLGSGNFLDAINFTATIDPPNLVNDLNDLDVDISNNTAEKAICYNTKTQFTATGLPGSTFYWYDSDEIILLHEGSAFTTPILTENTTYKVKQINTSNCESSFTEVKVIINPLPTLTIHQPEAVCSPETLDLTADAITTKGKSTDKLTYYTDKTALTILTNPEKASAGTYYIKSTNAEGCFVIEPVTVKVNDLPIKPELGPVTQPNCNTSTGSVTLINYDGLYTYNVIPSTDVVQNGNTITAPVGKYLIYASKGDCRSDTENLQINTYSELTAVLMADSLIPQLCAGEKDGSFKIEIIGGIKPYTLSLDNKNVAYAPITTNEYTFIELSGGSHTVYIKDALDCVTEIEVYIPKGITINPVANVSYSCLNDLPVNSVKITVDSSITDLDDLDYSLDGITYQSKNTFVNVPAGKQSIKVRHTNGCIQSTKDFTIDYIEPLALTLADGELNEIVATATGGNGQYRYSFNDESISTTNKVIIYKSGIYTVTVTDQNGCTTTSSKYFEYIDVCIPNNFTPNGDGINDEWSPVCTTQYKNLTFTIFDRYGRIIGNYKYGQKWDGKYNGAELPSGDYWYVFKLNDNNDNREFVGHFTLYR